MHDMVDLEHTEFERHVFAEDIESAKKEVIKKDILEVVVEEKHAHSPSHIFDDEKSRSIEKSVNGYEIQKGENNVFLKLWKVKYGLRHISDPIDKKEEYENYIVAFTDYDAKDLIEKVNQKKILVLVQRTHQYDAGAQLMSSNIKIIFSISILLSLL